MNGPFQGAHVRLKQLWTLLVEPSTLETDPTFRASLTEILYSGLRWGGIGLLFGVVAHMVISFAVWGGTLTWTYSAPGSGEFAIMHDVFMIAVGIGLVMLSTTTCTLSVGRFAEAVAVVAVCGASMHDDLLQGPAISVEFVVMIYMGAIVTVPFRPWQVLGIGSGILGLYVLLAGWGVFVPTSSAVDTSVWSTAPDLGLTVLIGTAVCTVLYATRRTQHRVRREAETELTAAKEQAERALGTVEEQADQLRELDEMKSRFFANISHELRTPLSLMIGPVRQLLEREDWPEEEAEMLHIVHRNAERLQRLVEQLLDLARYDAGRLDLKPQQKTLGPFVEQVLHRLTPMADAQDVVLSVDTDKADRAVFFDPDHMETVISNLVRNAITYTPRDGTVAVRAEVTATEARLVVEDNGPGISEEEQEVLFDRYYRGAEQAQIGGTGIGLALTKRLVSLHDGWVEVDSALGEGSTFEVRWPATPESEIQASAASVEVAAGLASLSNSGGDGAEGWGLNGPGGPVSPLEESGDGARLEQGTVDRTTILIVEDNADVRRYVQRLLEPRYRVLEAENGQEGLERVRSVLPDLVIADVRMPEMDGFEMVRALRQSRRTDCIPVVMLTARAEETAQIEGLEGGAEAYVTKPFDAEVLIAQINRLISTRRQLRDRFEEEGTIDPEPTAADESPESFEDRVEAAARAHLTDSDFSVEQLAEAVGCTRRTLTRRLKEEVGQTPSRFIRTMRVERGAELLDEGAGTISEVAYAVGFNSLSYFSRSFKEHFGCTPSAYQREDA